MKFFEVYRLNIDSNGNAKFLKSFGNLKLAKLYALRCLKKQPNSKFSVQEYSEDQSAILRGEPEEPRFIKNHRIGVGTIHQRKRKRKRAINIITKKSSVKLNRKR